MVLYLFRVKCLGLKVGLNPYTKPADGIAPRKAEDGPDNMELRELILRKEADMTVKYYRSEIPKA